MTNFETNQLSEDQRELGRVLTKLVAPVEAPFFDDLLHKAENEVPRKSKEHELGFGVTPPSLDTVSVYLVLLSKPILDFLWDNSKGALGNLVKDAAEGARTAFKTRLKQWFAAKLKHSAPERLPLDKIEELLTSVDAEAQRLGIKPEVTAQIKVILKDGLQHKSEQI